MKDLFVYGAFRAGMGVVGLLPRSVARRMGELAGLMVFWLVPGRRRMTIRHARRLREWMGAGGSNPADDRRHARRMFAAYGRYWAEALWIRPRRVASVSDTTGTEGMDQVEAAHREGRGMIFVLPHVGNWEIAGPIAGDLGIPLVAVAENLRNRHIRDWFVRLRNQLGIEIVLATGGTAVMRDLESFIRDNGAVALLSDRDLRSRGVPVDFFGENTTLPAGPVALAMRTGAPLFPVAAYFDGPGHRVVVHPRIDLPTTGSRSERLREGTQRVALALERLICSTPEQWHMLQPNWPSDRAAAGLEAPSSESR